MDKLVRAISSDGMLMVTKIGGIYPTTYPGHKVRVYTKNGVIFGAVANSREISKNKELEALNLRLRKYGENVDELTREVREHNGFARRMPVVEEQIKVINHRLADLERIS